MIYECVLCAWFRTGGWGGDLGQTLSLFSTLGTGLFLSIHSLVPEPTAWQEKHELGFLLCLTSHPNALM
jgi:hypothetical protein